MMLTAQELVSLKHEKKVIWAVIAYGLSAEGFAAADVGTEECLVRFMIGAIGTLIVFYRSQKDWTFTLHSWQSERYDVATPERIRATILMNGVSCMEDDDSLCFGFHIEV